MPMRNPPHPGASIRFELEDAGISIAQFAKALGVTRQQLYNVINGKSAISAEMAMRLELGLGGTAEGWLRLQATYDLAQLRLNGQQMQVINLFKHPPLAQAG